MTTEIPEVPDVPEVIPTDPPEVPSEERCGDIGPKGHPCRLRKDHPPGLHAAHGETWAHDEDGWRPPSVRAVEGADPASPDDFLRTTLALHRRGVVAAERSADALEGIRQLVDHWVETTLHKVQGHT